MYQSGYDQLSGASIYPNGDNTCPKCGARSLVTATSQKSGKPYWKCGSCKVWQGEWEKSGKMFQRATYNPNTFNPGVHPSQVKANNPPKRSNPDSDVETQEPKRVQTPYSSTTDDWFREMFLTMQKERNHVNRLEEKLSELTNKLNEISGKLDTLIGKGKEEIED